jgi:hypothetical protein
LPSPREDDLGSSAYGTGVVADSPEELVVRLVFEVRHGPGLYAAPASTSAATVFVSAYAPDHDEERHRGRCLAPPTVGWRRRWLLVNRNALHFIVSGIWVVLGLWYVAEGDYVLGVIAFVGAALWIAAATFKRRVTQ